MPTPIEFFAEMFANASKPGFKVVGDPGGAKIPKTEFDKFIEARVREGVVIAPALIRFFPVTVSHFTRPVLAVDFAKPGTPSLTRYAPLYAAPQPIGVVPPSAVGLPPGYMGKLFPSLPKSTYLHTAQLTPEQQREFEIAAFKKKAGAGAAVLVTATGNLPDNRTFAAHVIDTIVHVRERTNEFLADQLYVKEMGGVGHIFGGHTLLGAAAQDLVSSAPAPPDQQSPGPAQLPPGEGQEQPGAAQGGFAPQAIEPGNLLAIAAAAAAAGIRNELVTEHADP